MRTTFFQIHRPLWLSVRRALALWASLLLLGAAAALLLWQITAPTGSDVIARVNGEAITELDLQRILADPAVQRQALLERESGSLRQGPLAERQAVSVDESRPLDPTALERTALRKLILRRLLLQEAARRNITVTERELGLAAEVLKRRFKDAESYAAWRKTQGLDDQALLEVLRNEILVIRVSGTLVQDVRLSEEDVKSYFEAHQAELAPPDTVHLQIVAVKDKSEAEVVYAALREGEDFGRLARARPTGTRAAQGWLTRDQLSPAMRTAVARLRVGETHRPVPKGSEFLVVRLVGQKAGRTLTLAEARHEIERRLLGPLQREAIMAWLTRQEKQSRIEILR